MIWGLMLGKKIQRNGDFTSDSHDPHFSASAELVDSAVAAGVGNADTASIFARHRNQMWSLRNHKWWFEWDIHSKYVTYYVTGLFITFVVPAAHMAVFGSQEAVVVPAE
jgi:hypothetical protein